MKAVDFFVAAPRTDAYVCQYTALRCDACAANSIVFNSLQIVDFVYALVNTFTLQTDENGRFLCCCAPRAYVN